MGDEGVVDEVDITHVSLLMMGGMIVRQVCTERWWMGHFSSQTVCTLVLTGV